MIVKRINVWHFNFDGFSWFHHEPHNLDQFSFFPFILYFIIILFSCQFFVSWSAIGTLRLNQPKLTFNIIKKMHFRVFNPFGGNPSRREKITLNKSKIKCLRFAGNANTFQALPVYCSKMDYNYFVCNPQFELSTNWLNKQTLDSDFNWENLLFLFTAFWVLNRL